MGLLDVLNGMQHGPRGSSDPNKAGGGMSPLTMAIFLALLAYKAVKKMGGSQPGTTSTDTPPSMPDALPGNSGGSLSDIVKGGLGGLLAGAAGSILSSGLGDLLKQFQENGQSEAANSWVSTAPNKTIAPDDLANALGADQINTLMTQSGLSRDELLHGLSQHLPEVVNQLTPDGQLPTAQEAARWI